MTIEGATSVSFTESVATRFLAYGWSVQHVRDANEAKEVLGAFNLAIGEKDRPTLIIIESHIGYGAPHKQDSPEAHGEPLGPDEVMATKAFYGWPEDAQFLVPDGVYEHFANGVGKRDQECGMEGAVRPVRQGLSGSGGTVRRHAEARASRGLG